MNLTFVTGNQHKLLTARAICMPAGIEVTQTQLDITEIQAAHSKDIAKAKANEAFRQLGKPLVVTDDSWIIPGLKGFPGPYMKYLNDWFTPDDWIRLTKDLTDRRIMLEQTLVYQDASQQKVFQVAIEGHLLKKAKGQAIYPNLTITSFDDQHKSVAELTAAGKSAIAHLLTAWHELCDWLAATHH